LRIIVIGATGHIGTYLVPRLLAMGHEVVGVSRGQRDPYRGVTGWTGVERVTADRSQEDEASTFGKRIADLSPDVVIDLICFDLPSAQQIVEALDGRVQHFLHCGTLWVHGPSATMPTDETVPRTPFGDYGVKKAEIEAYLLDRARRSGFPATIVHPGHISGPGWTPINPAGHVDLTVFENLANGKPIQLPDQGLYTLHHVHADDVAQIFQRAVSHWSASVGEAFHAASPAALTLRGYAEAVASWFGHDAVIEYLPWEKWKADVSDEIAGLTWDHIAHSPCASIEKAKTRLGHQPRYTSPQAIREALAWLIREGKVKAPSLD